MPDISSPYISYTIALVLSAVISIYAVRKIIFITRSRKLYDIPDNIRKIHSDQIPSLGGIGIFIGYMVVAAFFMQQGWYYVMAASIVLFFTGIYDDIMNMRPSKKLLAQLVASLAAVYLADIRIGSLHGLLGVGELPYWFSLGLTTFCCTFFINVFNFVDGIDGLACVMAILYTAVLGLLFAGMGLVPMAGISFGLTGATLGLLFFNRAPARIYMGDTGSMMLGFTIFMLSLRFLALFDGGNAQLPYIHSGASALLLICAMLYLPVFDALRVFVLRLSRGISPLRADRTHLHYYLLDAGCSHTQAMVIIVATNILLMGIGYLLQDQHPLVFMVLLTAFLLAMLGVIYRSRQHQLHSRGL